MGWLATVAPGWAERRARARLRLERIERATAFRRQAAVPSRNRKQATGNLGHPERGTSRADRVQLMRDARELVHNDPVIKGTLRKLAWDTVGRLRYEPQTGDKKADEAYKLFLARFGREADITGRHGLADIYRIAVASMLRDGDCGLHIVRLAEEDADAALLSGLPPFRVRLVEADRIGDASLHLLGKEAKNPDRDMNGVLVDAHGRPLKYQLYKREGSGFMAGDVVYEKEEEVDADDFLHLYDADRFDEYRGWTALDTAIAWLNDIRETEAAEMFAAKAGAYINGVVKNADGQADPEDFDLDDTGARRVDEAGRAMEKPLQPGENRYLAEGEEFTQFASPRPNVKMDAFLETRLRKALLSIGVPLGYALQWPTNGTAARLEATDATREILRLQCVCEQKLWRPLTLMALRTGIDLGMVPETEHWDRGEFAYPPRPTADVGRESAAQIEELRHGVKTMHGIGREDGWDYSGHMATVEAEIDDMFTRAHAMAEKHGVPMELALGYFRPFNASGTFPKEEQPAAAPAAPGRPAPAKKKAKN